MMSVFRRGKFEHGDRQFKDTGRRWPFIGQEHLRIPEAGTGQDHILHFPTSRRNEACWLHFWFQVSGFQMTSVCCCLSHPALVTSLQLPEKTNTDWCQWQNCHGKQNSYWSLSTDASMGPGAVLDQRLPPSTSVPSRPPRIKMAISYTEIDNGNCLIL